MDYVADLVIDENSSVCIHAIIFGVLTFLVYLFHFLQKFAIYPLHGIFKSTLQTETNVSSVVVRLFYTYSEFRKPVFVKELAGLRFFCATLKKQLDSTTTWYRGLDLLWVAVDGRIPPCVVWRGSGLCIELVYFFCLQISRRRLSCSMAVMSQAKVPEEKKKI